MDLSDFRDIKINWAAFERMGNSQKTKALQNLLATLSASEYNGTCALLSLHASGLIDIDFYNNNHEGEWDFWCELLNKQYKQKDEEDY